MFFILSEPHEINRNLEIFIKVAESGSITRTAKTMYITQPAVSNAISKLETGLNVKLFYRDRHNGMILTEVGHKILLLAKTLEYYSGEELKYLDIRNPKDIYAQLPDVKVRLGEMNSTINNRVKNIASILPQIKTLNKKIKYIDLQWEETQYIKLEE